MKIIYIAGPYRAPTERGLEDNIRHAEEAAIRLWRLGWAVICPHKNSSHFGGIIPDDNFIEGDIEILKRCDAIYLLSNWHYSTGARMERDIALEKGMAVYTEDSQSLPTYPRPPM